MATPTIVTFLWRGWRPVYDHRHVNCLARMLQASSGLPLICITDNPTGITECETRPLWPSVVEPKPTPTNPRPRNCFRRLKLFDPETANALGERIVNIDLDCVVLGNIRSLFETEAPFKAIRGIANPINGSFWMIKSGTYPEVWSEFVANPLRALQEIARARHNGKPLVGSDQAWISLKIKKPPTWWVEDGVQQLSHYQSSAPCRLLFFAGKHKPWDIACKQKHPEAYEVYRHNFAGNPQSVASV